jgi:hypothetical protein
MPSAHCKNKRHCRKKSSVNRNPSKRDGPVMHAPGSLTRALLLVAGAAAALMTAAGAAQAGTPPPPGRETVAAIDPSLVAGRGAQLGIAEQEAENAVTDGTVLPFDTSAYTLSGEASGRQAVQLAPGQSVAFTLTRPANAMTVRYAIPDAPAGGGIDAPLVVTAQPAGKLGHARSQTITLTSRYSNLYNEYPFTNDPNADVLHPDWWTTECSCVPDETSPPPVFPKPFRPMHFYDEQRVLLGRTYNAGDVVRVTAPVGTDAAWTVIDLADFLHVARPARMPRGAVPVTAFGADPTGARDSGDAFALAIAVGEACTARCSSRPARSRSTGT